ncbi:asparagine synthase (glutamine-hydrolyzing) [Streptosporangium sp. NPDC000239]|uniref:asparagine synthase (glutamine-hydrolyzing) n=1 Tax=Streptosporangium sp. NPDC000239 TaxID=3154248 RepID=UPI00332F5ECE
MCGLAGLARIDGGHTDATTDALLERMARIIAHRGPDDRELLRQGPVGLAFTRLSLVDPESGGQPLSTEDGDLVLIANGEVYNHRELAARLPAGTRLKGGSDCEVLLHLYRERGDAFLDEVRGMFAIVLWDRRRGRLVLARDRFGIKPLYYHRDGRRVVFASEIKALFADPATPRSLDWEQALTHPMLSAAPYPHRAEVPSTWFTGIECVPAGRIVQIDLADGTTREHTYWSLPTADADASEEEFVRRYGELLAESVAECATADAELGVFLSGGVDSAAVTALATPYAGRLHTFTVLSASTLRNGDAEHASWLAGKLGLPNHQVCFEADRIPSPDEWKRLLWLMEHPQCGPEQYYKHELHRYAKQARPELRGMLLGAASDEFNGGYSVDYSGGGGWDAFVATLDSMACSGALRTRPGLAPWWTRTDVPLLSRELLAVREDPYRAYLAAEYSKIQQYNCWHEDRTAAGSGIEARVPFLDHRLVELVLSIPPSHRKRLLWDKTILRESMRGVLPDRIAAREKVPFFYGEGQRHTHRVFLRMLRGDGAALVEEALAAPGASGALDGPAVRGLLGSLTERDDLAQVEILLRLVNLGLLSQMVSDLPPPVVDMSAGPVPVALGGENEARTEEILGCAPSVEPGSVPAQEDGFLLLADTTAEGTWYVAVDGAVRYVLEKDDDWLDLLRSVDGARSVAEIAELTGRPGDQVARQVAEAVEHGMLHLIEEGTGHAG